MIDINKIVSDAIEAEVSKAVARILIGPGLQETVNSFIQTYLEDHPPQVPNLGQLRAQMAADTEQLLVRIRELRESTQQQLEYLAGLNGRTADALAATNKSVVDNEGRLLQVAETLSGMQEHFALKDVVNADIEGINRVLDTRASIDAVEKLDDDIGRLGRHVAQMERDSRTNEIDSDELATTIADLFSDGTLSATITIDKV